MKRYLLALAALAILLPSAWAQRPGPFVPPQRAQPGAARVSPSPANLGRDRFLNITPPVVMGTPVPFFAGAGFPAGTTAPALAATTGQPVFASPVNPFE